MVMDWVTYCKILVEEEEVEVGAEDHLPLVATAGPGNRLGETELRETKARPVSRDGNMKEALQTI